MKNTGKRKLREGYLGTEDTCPTGENIPSSSRPLDPNSLKPFLNFNHLETDENGVTTNLYFGCTNPPSFSDTKFSLNHFAFIRVWPIWFRNARWISNFKIDDDIFNRLTTTRVFGLVRRHLQTCDSNHFFAAISKFLRCYHVNAFSLRYYNTCWSPTLNTLSCHRDIHHGHCWLPRELYFNRI